MKKVIKIFFITVASIIGLLIAAVIVTPLLFKEQIKRVVIAEADKMVDAHLYYDDFSLSLIRNFPNLNFRLDRVSITGKGAFEGDTLAGFRSFGFVFDIKSLWGDEGYQVKSIVIDRPVAHAVVLPDGRVNWDIMIPSGEGEEQAIKPEEIADETASAGGKEMMVNIEEVVIKDGILSFDDYATGMSAAIDDLDITVSGKFSEKVTTVEAALNVARIKLVMDGVTMLNNISAGGDLKVAADLENSFFTLSNNSFRVNDITLGVDGTVGMMEESIDINLALATSEASFRSLLSLVPAIYMGDYDALKAEGTVKLDVKIAGSYNSTTGALPPVNSLLEVKGGAFSFGSDPDMVNGLNASLNAAVRGSDIKGSLTLRAASLNLASIMKLMPSDTLEEEVDTTALEVIEIPANIDFEITAELGSFSFDPLAATDLRGHIVIRDQQLLVDNTGMKTLGGEVNVDAAYVAKGGELPSVTAGLSAKGIGIKESFETFNTVRKLAPVAEGMDGSVSVDFDFVSRLKSDMMPELNSIDGVGSLSSESIELVNSTLFGKFQETLKLNDGLTNTFNDVNVNFSVKGGRVYFKPFDVKMGKLDMKVSGDHGLDQTINYMVGTEIPATDLPGPLSQLASGLAAQAKMFGLPFTPPERYIVNVGISGTVKDPAFKPNVTVPGSGDGALKTAAKQAVDAKVEEVKQVVREEIDQASEKILEEAQKQADAVKAEAARAAEAIRAEAKVQADRLLKEAESRGAVAKIAAKKAADLAIAEAEKKASLLEAEAAVKADRIMEEARKKAGEI